MFADLCRMVLPLISASSKPPYVHELPLPSAKGSQEILELCV
uniref:Uncharacterized protein n=1 Tax=Setaria italica TaxID=4555 RepID=K3Z1N2_SETIT